MTTNSTGEAAMTKRQNISVSVTTHQAEFLAASVASGRYQTTTEVVREAMRLFEDQQRRHRAEIAQARLLIAEGADQLDRGEFIDGEKFFQDWDTELDALESDDRPKTQ